MEKNKKPFIVNRQPADMHGDGVYFNENLLVRKHKKELEKIKIENRKK